MDFDAVFKLILKNFQDADIHFALIGGFALASLGHPRATYDIDFLLDKKDLSAVKKIMASCGYKLLYESGETATFQGGLDKLGRVDFILAHRKYTAAMLAKARPKKILNGKYEVMVLLPEDLIGLKVQSASNDPERYHQDMADIEVLLKENYNSLDMALVEEYFSIFGRKADLDQMLEKIKHAE